MVHYKFCPLCRKATIPFQRTLQRRRCPGHNHPPEHLLCRSPQQPSQPCSHSLCKTAQQLGSKGQMLNASQFQKILHKESIICQGFLSLMYGGKDLYESLECRSLLMANISLYFYVELQTINRSVSIVPSLMIIVSGTQFHVFLPSGQRLFSIVS